MKKAAFLSLVFALVSFTGYSQDKKSVKLIADVVEAKAALLKADRGLDVFFNDAKGYVIFPNVGKGAFIIGAASGNGVVYENGVVVGMADLKKVDIGLQAGGQAITEVIFFETEKALTSFKEGNFQFTAEASAVAVKSGIARNASYADGVLVFALPKAGLMAEASVGGQKFKFSPLLEVQ